MAESNEFVGFWKILSSIPVAISFNSKRIEGTVFHLSQTGDVTWKIPQGAISIPLFNCDCYEVVSGRPYLNNSTLRFGAYKGHVIDCLVTGCEPYCKMIALNDGWCIIICKRFDNLNWEDGFDVPFSFLQALQDSYFSDLTLRSNNNKKFSVHTCILKLAAPEIDWSNKNNPLSKLPEDVVSAILHFLYAQCLPEGLDEGTINEILSAASQIPNLEDLVLLCQSFIDKVAVKKKIFGLISEIHMFALHLIENFSNKHSSGQLNNTISDPVKLCFAVKSSIRDAAVAVSKVLVFCNTYGIQKDKLSKEDELEIIFHIKNRIPALVSQLRTFFQLLKTTFSDLLPFQRQELACHLVQEIETIFEIITSVSFKMKNILEILAESEMDETSCQKMSDNFTDRVFHRKEVNRLRGMIRRITSVWVHSHHKKENMKLLSNGNKIRSVAKDLEQVIGEDLPIFALWLEEFITALEEKLKQNKSQFCFKVGISRVNEVIKKLVKNKKTLQGVLVQFCDLVQRDSFAKSLVLLGLLDSSVSPMVDSGETTQEESTTNNIPTHQMPKFSTKNSFCVSPPANRNRLSKAADDLLKSERETDMVFEIINAGDSENGAETDGEVSVESQTSSPRPKYCTMVAHRVIVSARCDWFRRALLSGMQESINRKIQVYDTTPSVFSSLLKYLYSGQLDCASLSADHISELLRLSDRYELDSLKQVCEYGLNPHIDVDSVVYFYSIADLFNAKFLKRACQVFIIEHPQAMEFEMLEELPENLQSELYSAMISARPHSVVDFALERLLCNSLGNVEELEAMVSDFHISG